MSDRITKLIEVSQECIESLTIKAAKLGMVFKTYAECVLESDAVGKKCNSKPAKVDLIKKEVIEGVFLSDEQEHKTKQVFGNYYSWAIEKLSNYKMANGKSYKSDYHALIGWVKDEFQKSKPAIISRQQEVYKQPKREKFEQPVYGDPQKVSDIIKDITKKLNQ